jgi:class 3 adenylate cyclase
MQVSPLVLTIPKTSNSLNPCLDRSKATRELLHTLIPPQVLSRLEDADGDGATGPHEIPACTIMFCILDFDVVSKGDFVFLNALFAALDAAVERSGLFKYQAVACGSCHNFIVTCPRVASPHDQAPHQDYHSDMIGLGFELMRIVQRFRRRITDEHADQSGHGEALSPSDEATELHEAAEGAHVASARARNIKGLKVGISSGPAAGIVLGSCRRFWCVYGDTVNTAARMCKFSVSGKIRVTSAVGTHVCDWLFLPVARHVVHACSTASS